MRGPSLLETRSVQGTERSAGKTDVTIIAGIAGLALARRLAAEGVDHCIIEECSPLAWAFRRTDRKCTDSLADNFRLHNSLEPLRALALLNYSPGRINLLEQQGLLSAEGGLGWQPIHVNGKN